MTTPRIGDTVHYRKAGTQTDLDSTDTFPDQCMAALVTATNGTATNLRVHEPNACVSFGVHDIPYDTESITVNGAHGRPVIEQYTPGTWHHIH